RASSFASSVALDAEGNPVVTGGIREISAGGQETSGFGVVKLAAGTGDPCIGCDDENVCTLDTCDTTGHCSHTRVPDGTPCSDGNACNGLETCQMGQCAAGMRLDCDDMNLCTDDMCDPSGGCAQRYNHGCVGSGHE